MNLRELIDLFSQSGVTALFAKILAENDNSKNQVYFATAVETLNVFPSNRIYGTRTKRGVAFKAELNFGWLLDSGHVAPAPGAQLILYPQYPEVRFSGFLQGCAKPPSALMAARPKGRERTETERRVLDGRVLFLGVTRDRRLVGHLVAGDSTIAHEFRATDFPVELTVFRRVPIAREFGPAETRSLLLGELKRIHTLGWIESKQLAADGSLRSCDAPQCGGFTLEAELGIPKNSYSSPDFHGWEVKQYDVSRFDRIETSKPITLLTPEPTGGFYRENDLVSFLKAFGYPDKNGRVDRLNFGGRHFVNLKCKISKLTMRVVGYDADAAAITDPDGKVALLDDHDRIAAEWSFAKLFEHWSRKHLRAAFVPSNCMKAPSRQYRYGHTVRLAEGTNSLLLLKAFAAGAIYYDPGIKMEAVSSPTPVAKKRSQFRVAAKSIGALYDRIETVRL